MPTRTYDLAAPQLHDYVQPLAHGALALAFEIRDQDGRALKLDDDFLAGHPLLLVLIDPRTSEGMQTLADLAAAKPMLRQRQIACVVITANSDAAANAATRDQLGLTIPVCGDSTGVVFASYGVHMGQGLAARWVLLTPNRQIRAWYDSPLPAQTAIHAIIRLVDTELHREADTWHVPHAPVLVVPNVLTREECAGLLHAFETRSPLMIRPPRPGEVDGNYRIPVYEHNRQDRVDEIIKDPATVSFLDQRLFGRVVPLIKKSFGFEVTRREDLHIARYHGDREGNTMGHRDNVSAATAYRRFALSLNLNDDYDGGEVVFREYGNRGYKPEPGSAMIFSSALLHEVLETTQGTRYTLISHLFNDQTLQRA
ncbi:MAG: 2OG-Fe(II) oxygenase [Pseudomonadota bacterium]